METLERLEGLLARIVATHRPGQGLPLVGGFRFRLLNGSPRMSADVDYHWDGDLEEKRAEVAGLLERAFLPRVEEEFGFAGRIVPAGGPEVAASPLTHSVSTVSGEREDLPWIRVGLVLGAELHETDLR